MDHLWSPWRYRYVSKAEAAVACVFCAKAAEDNDAGNFIVYRGAHCFVILNLYPYTTGHLLVVPYAHVSSLGQASPESLREMFELTTEAAAHLEAEYRPRGLNIGMNLGECAGAGIAEHIHVHVLPRWPGDVNFMTSIGETRVLPEELPDTYLRLHRRFHSGRVSEGAPG